MPAVQTADDGIRKIVILGHTGFVGRNLESFFRNNYSSIEVLGKSLPAIDLTKYDDVLPLKNFFDDKTVVIMCSAIKRELGDNLDNFHMNVKMVYNLCKILESRPVKRLIYFSSTAVYGEDMHNTNISENTSPSPNSYYGIAKYASERLLHKTVNSERKCSLAIVRPPVIYGYGDQPRYGPSGFIKCALSNEPITLWGDGAEKREFIFIEDVVNLISNLAFHTYDGVLNIASGKSYTFIEIINIISSIINSKIEIKFQERTKNKVDHEFDNKLIARLFPNFRFTPLKEGIHKSIEKIQYGKLSFM